MPLTLEIVTPKERVYSDTIDTVVIPTTDGEIGVLPGHLSLVSQLAEGELRVTKDGKPLVLAVGGVPRRVVHAVVRRRAGDDEILEQLEQMAEDDDPGLHDALLEAVEHPSQAVRVSGTYPSSPKQLDLSRLLLDQLRGLGLEHAARFRWAATGRTMLEAFSAILGRR